MINVNLALNSKSLFHHRITALLCICCFFSLNTYAKNLAPFPKGCEVMGFQWDSPRLRLNQLGEQTIYFIQNISNKLITINHKSSQPFFMDMGLHAALKKNKWLSLAVNEQEMKLSCSSVSANSEKVIPCEENIRICQYPRVKFALSNQGTYLIAKNASLRQAMRKAINKGILLKW